MTTGGSSFWSSGAVPLIEPEFLGSIISAASDIALVISAEGVILSVLVNANDDGFGNLKHWEGRPVVDFLTEESIEKFDAAHSAYLDGQTPQRPIELNHTDNAVWQYPVRYSFHRFGSEDATLLLGRDLRPIAETQQQLVQAQISLERGYEARREFDAKYRVLLGEVSDAVVFVSVLTGRVEDTNTLAAELLGLKPDALRGANFASLFSNRSGAELTESLITATLEDEVRPIEAISARTQNQLMIHPALFRAAGQRVLMCRLLPGAAPEVAGSSNDKDAAQTLALFQRGTDPMLFTDAKGVVLSANDAFLDLVGATRAIDVTGQSFADFMTRGQIDLSLMLGGTDRAGQMRVYATRLTNKLGAHVSVEASLTRLDDDAGAVIGIVIRDVSRMEPERTTDHSVPGGLPEHSQKVVELVGSTSLKEIVAETTDVVEKMCIETAVNLTRNNRVAAAEMLGLSRQSLYVKLRKFGLLSKN